MSNKVFIIGWDGNISNMFEKRGWETVSRLEEADLVQFTGGADVSPALYGEDNHPRTFNSKGRDDKELGLFQEAKSLGIPCVGICRGGQFLNVVSGGKMWQDVNNHAVAGTHLMTDKDSGLMLQVTSTHHQQMRVGKKGELVASAGHISKYRQHMADDRIVEGEMSSEDVEVVYYKDTDSLCHQPHPEYLKKDHECQVYYFDLIKKYFGLGD